MSDTKLNLIAGEWLAGEAEMVPAGVQRVELLSPSRQFRAAVELSHEGEIMPDIGEGFRL